MPIKNKSVIIDTNLWIRFLISEKFIKLDNIILKNEVQLIFSQELLAEFFEVIARPKFKKIFSKELVSRIMELISDHSVLVNTNSIVSVCRDPEDNFLLALAKDAKADFLLTGDKDLLEIGKFGTTRILSYKDFLKFL